MPDPQTNNMPDPVRSKQVNEPPPHVPFTMGQDQFFAQYNKELETVHATQCTDGRILMDLAIKMELAASKQELNNAQARQALTRMLLRVIEVHKDLSKFKPIKSVQNDQFSSDGQWKGTSAPIRLPPEHVPSPIRDHQLPSGNRPSNNGPPAEHNRSEEIMSENNRFVDRRLVDQRVDTRQIHDQQYQGNHRSLPYSRYQFSCQKCGKCGHRSVDCRVTAKYSRPRSNFQG